MSEPIVILGASVRAAAYSAVRGGLRPWCADLFADADLRRLCPATRIERYPCDFVTVAGAAPPGPFMYTGGLENYPRVVERIAATRRLHGTGGASLRLARDPWRLAEIARRAGVHFPAMRETAAGLPRDGTWIRKGLRSSGGARVESWDQANNAPGEVRGWYFQERVEGISFAAAFIAAGQQLRLLGITRQFIGGDGELGNVAGALPFHYAGSVGPVELEPGALCQLMQFGESMQEQCPLTGLFGIDFIQAEDTVWPIEVNPRYPASVEVLERAMGFSAVAAHVQACRDDLLPPIDHGASPVSVAGKAIIFATTPVVFTEELLRSLESADDGNDWPTVADIPSQPTTFSRHSPMMTLLAESPDLGQAVGELSRRINAARREWESAD